MSLWADFRGVDDEMMRMMRGRFVGWRCWNCCYCCWHCELWPAKGTLLGSLLLRLSQLSRLSVSFRHRCAALLGLALLLCRQLFVVVVVVGPGLDVRDVVVAAAWRWLMVCQFAVVVVERTEVKRLLAN